MGRRAPSTSSGTALTLRSPVSPAGGRGTFRRYNEVRNAPDPRGTLLEFLQSTYETGGSTAGWDADGLLSSWWPGTAFVLACPAGSYVTPVGRPGDLTEAKDPPLHDPPFPRDAEGSRIVVTLVPFVIALAVLLAVSLVPFVGAFALLVSLVALLVWGLWKAGANVLELTGENVFRLAKTSDDLLGRGGPDDPEWMLVPRQRRPRIEGEPLQRSVVPTASAESKLAQASWGVRPSPRKREEQR